uniref:Condensin complex subunit 3 n=2 Tax=Bursaphelenchus xylophilus TaxID=6326 RepID=A0A1I7SSD9_BURXY
MAHILAGLAEFHHVPSDFDHYFFKNLTQKLFLSNLVKLEDIYSLLNRNSSSTTLLCALIASFLNEDNLAEGVGYVSKHIRDLLEASNECSCLKQLLYDLAMELEKRKLLQRDVKDVLLSSGATVLLSERSNVVIRRQIAHFMVEVSKDSTEEQEIRAVLFKGWMESDDVTVIDEASYVFRQTDLFETLDKQQIEGIYKKFLELTRPGLNVIKLIASILLLNENEVLKKIEDVEDKRLTQQLCSELLKTCTLQLQPELLRVVVSNIRQSSDCVIEYLEEIEDIFQEEMTRIRRDLNANLPLPKKCSNDSLIKYLNYIRLRSGVSSSEYIQAFDSAKLRIQNSPEILDFILSESEELCDLLRENLIRNVFNDLTVNILMVKGFPNWILVDSAILILDKIADFFDYDEDTVHKRIFELMKTREHEDIDYVKESAAKFLLKNCPDMIKEEMKGLFLNGNNLEIRIAVLERLLLTSDSELASLGHLNDIMEEVLLLESNIQVKEKALILLERLEKVDEKWKEKSAQLKEMFREEKNRLDKKNDLEILTQMIENVKTSADCFDDHVAKECY